MSPRHLLLHVYWIREQHPGTLFPISALWSTAHFDQVDMCASGLIMRIKRPLYHWNPWLLFCSTNSQNVHCILLVMLHISFERHWDLESISRRRERSDSQMNIIPGKSSEGKEKRCHVIHQIVPLFSTLCQICFIDSTHKELIPMPFSPSPLLDPTSIMWKRGAKHSQGLRVTTYSEQRPVCHTMSSGFWDVPLFNLVLSHNSPSKYPSIIPVLS